MSEPLDVLAFAAHPDDAELCAGGTMCVLANAGYRVGIVDLTRGELGSRGSPELRALEVADASEITGLSAREYLAIDDGRIENTQENRLKVIRAVRRHRPHVALIGPPECRHPDHGAGTRLCVDAFFYAGLRKIETLGDDGLMQEPWRPPHVLHYMQAIPFDPTFVVDVSDVWDQRTRAMQAFKTQFYNPDYEASADEPETFVSSRTFFEWIEARARTYGYRIGATYGEPFLYHQGPIGVKDLVAVLKGRRPLR